LGIVVHIYESLYKNLHHTLTRDTCTSLLYYFFDCVSEH